LLGPPQDFAGLVIGGLTILVPLALACFFLGFNRKERRFFIDKLLKRRSSGH
jgi:hypothetical protein